MRPSKSGLKTKNCQGITLGSFKTHYIKSIFLLVPHEVFLGGVVRPDIFNGFVDFRVVVVQFLQVLDDLVGGAGAGCVVDKFVFGCRPRSVVQWSF